MVLVSQPPASNTAGSLFGFTAEVEDTFGNIVTGYSGTLTVSAAPGNTLGGASFAPVTVPVVAGLADFSGLLSLNRPSTTDVLQVSTVSNGMTLTALTNTFTVTPAAASQLVVTSGPTPSPATAGGNIGLTVAAGDAFGNVVTGDTTGVSVVLTNNTTGAILGGVTSVNVVSGVATFTGLNVNLVGSGYTFQVSSGSPARRARRTPFSIVAGQANHLQVTTEPPLDVTVGSTFTIAVTGVRRLREHRFDLRLAK